MLSAFLRKKSSSLMTVLAAFMAILSAGVSGGCGNSSEHEHDVVIVEPHNSSAEFVNALLASEQSEPVVFSRQIPSADSCVHMVQGASQEVLSTPLALNVNSAQALFDRCEQVFNCSDYGRDVLRRSARSGQQFTISFVDFASIPGTIFTGNVFGVYLPSTSRIFLRSDRTVTGGALVDECGTLLHEMVHWLHDLNQQRIGTFEDEYDAYYFENRFHVEYSSAQLTTAGQARRGEQVYRTRYIADNSPLTLLSLARLIIRAYEFDVSDTELYRIINRYTPFPWESQE